MEEIWADDDSSASVMWRYPMLTKYIVLWSNETQPNIH